MIEKLKDFSRYLTDHQPLGVWFLGETLCAENLMIERECSNLMSLEYIASGSGTLEINGQTLHPKAGDVFLLTKGSRHRYYADTRDPWHKYFVVFTGPVAFSFLDHYLPEDTYLFPRFELEAPFKRIVELGFDPTLEYQEMADAVSIELMKVFVTIHSRSIADREELPDRIKKRIDYYVEHCFSLEALCADFHYSKNHIINLFKSKYHQTPYQYYMHAKMETAKRYLTESSMSIAEIAERLSFSDQQYFAAALRKATGYSPKEYRRLTKLSIQTGK